MHPNHLNGDTDVRRHDAPADQFSTTLCRATDSQSIALPILTLRHKIIA